MPRKQRTKYFYIYKTTNLINGKYYIGRHCTYNLNDNYLGSGRRLRYSIKKYGENNFKKEILQFVKTFEELIERENQIVNAELVNDSMCMNLKVGGIGGGFVNEEHRKKCSDAGNKQFVENLKNDEQLLNKFKELGSKNTTKRHREGKVKYDTFTGRKHSEESIDKMKESHKGLQTKELNSQFGTCWIRNENENKKIKVEELNSYLEQGWIKGRKIKKSSPIA